MAEVVLFHHAQGLTPGVIAFADQLRASGHTVHTPDLFDGHTFDTLEEGLGYAGKVGFGAVTDRGVRAAEGCPPRWCTPASRAAWSRPSTLCRRGRAGERSASTAVSQCWSSAPGPMRPPTRRATALLTERVLDFLRAG